MKLTLIPRTMIEKNADVVLISEGVIARALAPYRLATEIRDAGYTCQIIDHISFFNKDEVVAAFTSAIGPNTKIVGISSAYIVQPGDIKQQRHLIALEPFSLRTLSKHIEFIKKLNPNVKVVLGGPNAEQLCTPEVDVFMTGYCDKAIIEYLKFLEGNNPFFQYDLHTTGQMIVHGNNYNTGFDFSSSQVKYHKSDNLTSIENVLAIEVARGCIFKCKFCSYPLNGKKNNDYIKKPDVLKDEFLRNYHEYGVTKYVYVDDTHNDNIVKLRQMADIVQSLPFKLEYASYIRLDLLTSSPEQYQLLKDGGLKSAIFGIETLNYETAKAIGKPTHPKKIIDELYKFKEKLPHVLTQSGFICGLPHETKESILEWTELISKPDFPLDNYIMSICKITKNLPSKVYLSDFEADPFRYYTWDKENPDNWHNGHFDRNWAVKFVIDHSTETVMSGRQKVSGWAPFLLQNIGYDETVYNRPRSEVFKEYYTKQVKAVQMYKDALLKNET